MPWITGVTTGADMATDFNALDADFDALLAGFDASAQVAVAAVPLVALNPADFVIIRDASDANLLKRVPATDIAGITLGGSGTVTLTAICREWRETIAAVGITASSRVQIWLAPEDDSLENSPELLDLVSLTATPGTDTLSVLITFSERTSGPINLLWSAS